MIVEIATHGSSIKRDHDVFVISDKTGSKSEIPAEKVDCIVVSANTMISTQAVRLCLEKQVQFVITEYNGKPLARMWSSTPGRASQIRRLQYTITDKAKFEICKKILILKVKRQKKLLLELGHNRKNTNIQLSQTILGISGTLADISKHSYVPNWKGLFLGLEGSVAQKYFRAISSLLPKKYQFETRSQHPALDPFNATLNYLYGMGYTTVEKSIIVSSLDPHAGLYHADSFGKPTLSFDIIEVARPVMDKVAITLFTRRQVSDTWFECDKNGVTLSKDARYQIIHAYRQECSKKIEQDSNAICKDVVKSLLEINP